MSADYEVWTFGKGKSQLNKFRLKRYWAEKKVT